MYKNRVAIPKCFPCQESQNCTNNHLSHLTVHQVWTMWVSWTCDFFIKCKTTFTMEQISLLPWHVLLFCYCSKLSLNNKFPGSMEGHKCFHPCIFEFLVKPEVPSKDTYSVAGFRVFIGTWKDPSPQAFLVGKSWWLRREMPLGLTAAKAEEFRSSKQMSKLLKFRNQPRSTRLILN